MDSKEAALWHAFDALDDVNCGTVPKSKLKVLSQNVGTACGVNGLEIKLEENLTMEDVKFDQFYSFLKQDLFDMITNNEKNSQSSSPALTIPKSAARKRSNSSVMSTADNIFSICWMLCSKNFHPGCRSKGRETETKKEGELTFSPSATEQLWHIFCFLAEKDENDDLITPVMMDHEEVQFVCNQYLNLTGQLVTPTEHDEHTVSRYKGVVFQSFLQTFEKECVNGMSTSEVDTGIQDLHDMFIKDILKKGILLKKGNAKTHTTWRERFFILQSKDLTYYTTGVKREYKGRITIQANHLVEGMADKPGLKQNRLSYTTENRTYEMSAPDLRVKNEWITVLRTAIRYVDKACGYQRQARDVRRQQREETRDERDKKERERIEDEHKIHSKISSIEAENREYNYAMLRMQEEAKMLDAEQIRLRNLAEKNHDELERSRLSREMAEQKLKSEADQRLQDLEQKLVTDIEAEKQARLETEQKLAEEAALREGEEERLKDLEELNERLKNLLSEEQEARKDEEIVRCLQARLLEEEFEKREQLEALQKQLNEQYAAEKQKSEELEMEKGEKESALLEAKRQQEQLETERQEADMKIEKAMKKLQEAEQKRQQLESQIKKRSAPIGLARPIPVEARPLLTHRGPGAFPKDFIFNTLEVSEKES